VPEDQELCAQAERFAGLFRAIYLTFHRRDGPRNELSGASRAVLQHLAMSGPLTVGEAAVHLDRAQSVDALDRAGRMAPADRDALLTGAAALIAAATERKGTDDHHHDL
jgi:hypothetical protein